MNRKELVEKMLEAAIGKETHMGSKYDNDVLRVMVDAALSVAIEELLGEPSEDEMIRTARQGVNWAFGKGLDYDRVRDIFANRRAKLERVKTPEERVTIERFHHPAALPVLRVNLDGVIQMCFEPDEEKHAEIYRLGLIQQLKDSA